MTVDDTLRTPFSGLVPDPAIPAPGGGAPDPARASAVDGARGAVDGPRGAVDGPRGAGGPHSALSTEADGALPDGVRDGDVAAAMAGDVAAFERLYRRHVGQIHALCRRMCGNASEAEEMVQEAFVRAWERLDSFRGDSAFGSWLHRLTVNVVLGSWRSSGRYRERVVAVGSYDERSDALLATHTGPAGLAVDLERAIDRLPTGARAVFVLHDIEGWAHRDIAERLGMAEGTSKTQLHRARRLLRGFLSPPSPDSPARARAHRARER